MQKIIVLSILALFPYISSYAALPPATEEAKQSPVFTEADKGYSITFPNRWHWQRDFMGLDVFAPAPIENEQAGSLGNISVVSGKLDNAIDLETFFNTNVDNLKKALRDVKVLETGKAFVDGAEARKIVYSHAMGDMKLRVLQYFVLKNGTGYIITCTASEEEFPKYADSFDASVRSFKLQ